MHHSCMLCSQGSSSASIQAKSCKSFLKENRGFSVHSDCGYVFMGELGSSVVSLTAARASITEISWSLVSRNIWISFVDQICWVWQMLCSWFLVPLWWLSWYLQRMVSLSGIRGIVFCSFSMSHLFCKLVWVGCIDFLLASGLTWAWVPYL